MDCYDELGNRYQLPIYVLSAPTNLIEDPSETDTVTDLESTTETGVELTLKLRLSSGKELKLTLRSTDSVLKAKRLLQSAESIEVCRQRWYFSGRLLSDKLRMEDAKIPKGFIVQVIVNPDNPTPVSS